MNIETKGLGAGSYPEPVGLKERKIKFKMYLICELEDEILDVMTNEEFINYAKENIRDFDLNNSNITIDDIEVIR